MKDYLQTLKEKAQASSIFIASQFEREDIYTNPEAMNELKKAMLLVKNLHVLILQIEKNIFNDDKQKMQLELLALKIEKAKTQNTEEESTKKEELQHPLKSTECTESITDKSIDENFNTPLPEESLQNKQEPGLKERTTEEEVLESQQTKNQFEKRRNNWHAANQNIRRAAL